MRQYVLRLIWILVDCVWSRFSVWTSCSVTCGGGLKTSSRTIAQKAENGGKDCDGDSVRGEKCNTHPCPGKKKNCLNETIFSSNLRHIIRISKLWYNI